MHDPKIDAETSDPDLRMDNPAALLQCFPHRFLERRVRITVERRGRSRKRARPALGIFEEMLQVCDCPRLRPRQVDSIRTERGKHEHFGACPRHGHIQAAFSSVPIERAEVHGDVTALIRAVSDAEQNHVPFVPLHGLQVFHEHWLQRGLSGECPFDMRISGTRFV